MGQSQVQTKHIYVHSRDLGFWTQEAVTVQRKEQDTDDPSEQNVIWCDHAGAVAEIVENEIINPNGIDIVWESNVLVCDKCDAYKPEGQNYWDNAPFEGVTQ